MSVDVERPDHSLDKVWRPATAVLGAGVFEGGGADGDEADDDVSPFLQIYDGRCLFARWSEGDPAELGGLLGFVFG